MTEKSLPSYTELSDALNETSLKLHASQAHGLICVILCGKLAEDAEWKTLITGGEESTQAHEVLQELFDYSAKQLQDFLFDFQLMLPPDSVDLPLRAEALTLWCQGLLTGLKLVKVPLVKREPGEITDVIKDLVEIAKMNYEDVVASEEDENAYIELAEYVRMAAILIYQDSLEQDASTKLSDSSGQLH